MYKKIIPQQVCWPAVSVQVTSSIPMALALHKQLLFLLTNSGLSQSHTVGHWKVSSTIKHHDWKALLFMVKRQLVSLSPVLRRRWHTISKNKGKYSADKVGQAQPYYRSSNLLGRDSWTSEVKPLPGMSKTLGFISAQQIKNNSN